jgi:hypothetical protein
MLNNKQIIFTSRKVPNNSFKMRGEQIAMALARMGYNTRCLPPREATEIKDGIIIWVRRALHDWLGHTIKKQKENGNILIYDPLDRIELEPPHDLMDAVIFPSIVQYRKHKIPSSMRRYMVWHHWDPDLESKNYDRNNFELGYWGYRTSCLHVFNACNHKNALTSARHFEYPDDDWFRRVSCHYSVRDYERGLGWRPTTKISTAAACNCNIIVSRDAMSEELLPNDYPYFVEGHDFESVKKVIEYAKYTYKKEPWEYGLKCMHYVKRFTSLERCSKLYSKIIEDIAR